MDLCTVILERVYMLRAFLVNPKFLAFKTSNDDEKQFYALSYRVEILVRIFGHLQSCKP